MPSHFAILALIWLHFLGDFILQSDKIAINKSKSNKWLLIHIGVYSLVLLPFGLTFAAVNGVAHMVTDWVTSRWSSRLWTQEKRHWFFVVIGLDQAIHLSCLVVSWELLNA